MLFTRQKLIVKYIGFLLIIGIFPLLTFGIVSHQISSNTLLQAENRFSETLLKEQRNLLQLQFVQIENLIDNISSVETITNALDDRYNPADTYTNLATQAQIGYILNGYMHLQGLISIDILTEGGAHYHVGDTLNINDLNRPVIKLIRNETLQFERDIYWAGAVPNINKNSNHHFVLSAARMLTRTDRDTLQKKPVALLLVNYSLEYIQQQFSEINAAQNSSLTLLDQKNHIIYSEYPQQAGRAAQGLIQHISSIKPLPESISWQNENYILHNLTLAGQNWQLLNIISQQDLLSSVRNIRDMNILLVLAGVTIILIAAWFYSYSVVGPVRNVIHSFERLERNAYDLTQRLPIRSQDEIGELVKWFNSFLDNLVAQRKAESALRESEASLVQAQQITHLGSWEWSPADNNVSWSEELYRILGFEPDTRLASTQAILDAVYPEDRDQVSSLFDSCLNNQNCNQTFEYRIVQPNGELRYIQSNIWTNKSLPSETLKVHGTLLDVTDQKLAEEELRKLSRAVESSSSGVIITDHKGIIEYVNSRFQTITGYSQQEIIGQKPSILNSGETPAEYYNNLWQTITSGDAWKGEFHNRKKNGELYWARDSISGVRDTNGHITHYIAIQEDVTHEYELNEQLSYQASNDLLTGLINRREFERRVERLISTTSLDQAEHALCFMDLDQFKIINDSCGHIAGDELLRQIARVLQNSVRHRDTLARLGGDEFGVLMEHCSLQQARRVTNAILKDIRDYQFIWEGQHFRVGISIGMVTINSSLTSLTELMKQADAACYMAKDLGRNRVHEYHQEDTEMIQRHGEMQWVGRINRALEDNRFRLYAQPIVSLQDHEDKHFELLIRMQDEQGNIIPPGQFLPAAERYNLIEKIDAWVVTNALALLSAHPLYTHKLHFVSINLSGSSLTNGSFLDSIIAQLKKSRIDPAKICFEITETVAISNLNAANSFISILKKIGCRFALDDFGSGLSSFGYLKNLPIDYLKIDGMFVKDMVKNPIDQAMVRSIHEIAQVMGMKTIAEFVENDAIIEVLKRMGVDYAQGYALGKPESFEQIISADAETTV
ncbi:MAG: EAL domain-containing protein [Gammaproteobacteria bacterium]|nr:EAL domain-containing protein [Gammaproteobacteria bacterium]